MCIPAKYLGVRPCRASSQQKLGKALNALCPLKDQRWKVGGPREGSGGAVRDAMCAATEGNNACESGEGCDSAVFNAGGGALMVAHKGQSSFGMLGLPESSPVTTSFIMPELVQTNIVDSGLTRGEAMAIPTDKANQTNTKRAI